MVFPQPTVGLTVLLAVGSTVRLTTGSIAFKLMRNLEFLRLRPVNLAVRPACTEASIAIQVDENACSGKRRCGLPTWLGRA